MHIPDGFLSPPVWGALDLMSVPAVAYVARSARKETEDCKIPLLGVLGAFVFAAQMINFPVGLGTSGHLIGGTLLAVLLGPVAASIVITAILVVQAFVFQDGGVVALGANIMNMAMAGVAAGYVPYRILAGASRRVAIFTGAVASVLVSAALALGELLASGVRMPARILWVSWGFFLISSLMEGAITVAAVQAIERISPARMPARAEARGRSFIAVTAILLIVGGVLVASTFPDPIAGLAAQFGLEGQHGPAWFHAPLADYQWAGVDRLGIENDWLRKVSAGLAGVILILGLGTVAGRLLSRQRSS